MINILFYYWSTKNLWHILSILNNKKISNKTYLTFPTHMKWLFVCKQYFLRIFLLLPIYYSKGITKMLVWKSQPKILYTVRANAVVMVNQSNVLNWLYSKCNHILCTFLIFMQKQQYYQYTRCPRNRSMNPEKTTYNISRGNSCNYNLMRAQMLTEKR